MFTPDYNFFIDSSEDGQGMNKFFRGQLDSLVMELKRLKRAFAKKNWHPKAYCPVGSVNNVAIMESCPENCRMAGS